MAKQLGAIALLSVLAPAAADLPLDCRREEVVGRWIFTLSNDLGKEVNCTGMNQHWDAANSFKVELKAPNVAILDDGTLGRWSMIYNQGFEIYIKDEVYFAFNKFESIPHSRNKYIYCGQTFDGWYHVDVVNPQQIGCFAAHKENPREAMARKVFVPPETPGPVDPKEEERRRKQKEDEEEKERGKNMHGGGAGGMSFADRINAAQTSWQAGDYSPEFEAQLAALMQRRRGPRRDDIRAMVQQSMGMSEHMPGANGATATRLMADEGEGEVDDEHIPDEWDWRDVDGVSYVGPIRNQGACGSCYAFASTSMLEARIRIASRLAQQPVLSPQQVVDCSFYSQGCDGGFAYLTAGKFAKDYGMVEEACLPYQGNETTYCPHARLKPCRRWFSNNHRYIGGFYGATTERAMRREIFLHGPVAVGLQVYPDLSKYKTGIYHYTGIPAEDTRLSPDDPLEPVNHALVAVGYGVDARTGEKYWVIQNSWGPEWGDKGYFKIRRGADEVGVESLVMAADPVL